MKITPVKGTNDYTPKEAALRDSIKDTILSVYQSHGFEHIITPAVEDAENLDKSDGGDNLNLIFKILKRGDKLKDALASLSEGGEDDKILSDMGLRYDLTLPLCRFYSANRASLPNPAKLIQIDRVYRAERPQKGRLREFTQCDIDIIGSSSPDCEVELIVTTARALAALGIESFRIKINDRSLLRSVLSGIGFPERSLDTVCVTFDKLDKIGRDGVISELSEKGFDEGVLEKFGGFLSDCPVPLEAIGKYAADTSAAERLRFIIGAANEVLGGGVGIDFDISLVRGQGYYTGTVFEIESTEFKGAVAGGGRYDNLIGKFTGESVPAVGFSIGFERIYEILKAKSASRARGKFAVIYSEGEIAKGIRAADGIRKEYDVTLFLRQKKFGRQLSRLEADGYLGFLSTDGETKIFGVNE